MKITFEEISQRWGMEDRVCSILHINPWALNEGLAQYEDTINVSPEQAKLIGISQREYESRSDNPWITPNPSFPQGMKFVDGREDHEYYSPEYVNWLENRIQELENNCTK